MPLKDEVEGLAEWLAGLMAEDGPAPKPKAMPYGDDWEDAADGLDRAATKFAESVKVLDGQIAEVNARITKLDSAFADRKVKLPWQKASRPARVSEVAERERLRVLRDLAHDLMAETEALSARARVLKRRAEPLPDSVRRARADHKAKARAADEAEREAKAKAAQEKLADERKRAEGEGPDAVAALDERLEAERVRKEARDKEAAERRAQHAQEDAVDPAVQVRSGQQSVETARGWIEAPKGKELDDSSLAFLEELDVLAEMALGLRQRIDRVQ